MPIDVHYSLVPIIILISPHVSSVTKIRFYMNFIDASRNSNQIFIPTATNSD